MFPMQWLIIVGCWLGVESGEYTGISIPVRGLCISKKLKEQPPAVICVK